MILHCCPIDDPLMAAWITFVSVEGPYKNLTLLPTTSYGMYLRIFSISALQSKTQKGAFLFMIIPSCVLSVRFFFYCLSGQ